MNGTTDDAMNTASAPTDPTWLDGGDFVLDGVTFTESWGDSTSSGHFSIRKHRALVERTLALVHDLRPQRIVELGIASGGGTALLALAARPERLMAVELACDRVAALDDLVALRGLAESLHAHYSVDQSDAPRIATLLDDTFGSDPVDLVVDDASHRYAESRASFEILFPRVRPGGVYVIEDWNWQLRLAHSIARGRDHVGGPTASVDDELRRRVGAYTHTHWSTPPLERLVLEIVLSRACTRDLIGAIHVEAEQVIVVRGSTDFEVGSFRLADTYTAAAEVLG